MSKRASIAKFVTAFNFKNSMVENNSPARESSKTINVSKFQNQIQKKRVINVIYSQEGVKAIVSDGNSVKSLSFEDITVARQQLSSPKYKMNENIRAKLFNNNLKLKNIDKLENLKKDSLKYEKSKIFTVDFRRDISYENTFPVKVTYFNQDLYVDTSWPDVYIKMLQSLHRDYPSVVSSGKSFIGFERVDIFGENKVQYMDDPKQVCAGMYVETNFCSTTLLKKIKTMLDICRVKFNNVTISYCFEENKELKLDDNLQLSNQLVNERKNENSSSREEHFPSFLNKKETEVKSTLNQRTDCNVLGALLSEESAQKVVDPYEKVLSQFFVKGFRLSSPIDMKKFRRLYEEVNGVSLNEENEGIEQHLRDCNSIVYENKVFLPQNMLDVEAKTKLLNYIENVFNSGKSAIYYEALFSELSDDFLNSSIYNADMLHSYLCFVLRNKFVFDRERFYRRDSIVADPIEEVRSCLKMHGEPMKTETICSILSHLPQDKISGILGSNLEFVRNSKGVYFHADMLSLSDKELENIAILIETSIKVDGFISGSELMNSIRLKYPSMYSEYSTYSDIGWRDALKYKFGNRFHFKGNLISGIDVSLCMGEAFGKLASKDDYITLDELIAFSEDMGSGIYFDEVYKNALRINEKDFVSKDMAAFQVRETDSVLDRFCIRNFISLTAIQDFSSFPEAGFPWSIYLLECYVSFYSEQYCLFHTGYNRNCAVGAIVKKKANYRCFDDVIVDVVADSNVDLNKKEVLRSLANAGFIARQSYANIDELIVRAKAKRNNKRT